MREVHDAQNLCVFFGPICTFIEADNVSATYTDTHLWENNYCISSGGVTECEK